MLARLLLLFVAVPLLELAILVWMGTLLGFWPTMGIVVLTGIVGAALAKSQGFLVWRRISTDLRQGRMPVAELFDGLLILIGGVVLLTPGLLTDVFGLVLLLPATRGWFKRRLRSRFEGMIRSGRVSVMTLVD